MEITNVLRMGVHKSTFHRNLNLLQIFMQKELAIWELEMLFTILFLLYMPMPKRHFVPIYIKVTDAISLNWEHFTLIFYSKVQEISVTSLSVQPNRFRFQKCPIPFNISDIVLSLDFL